MSEALSSSFFERAVQSGKNAAQSPTVSCRGADIRRRRQLLGWTQLDLANKAGYSLRLVTKAEAGGPIKRQSLEVLAQTLTENGQPVQAMDLILSNTANVAHRCVAAFNDSSTPFSSALGLLASTRFNLRVRVEANRNRVLHECKGREIALQWLRGVEKIFDLRREKFRAKAYVLDSRAYLHGKICIASPRSQKRYLAFAVMTVNRKRIDKLDIDLIHPGRERA